MGWNYLSIPKLQRLHRWSLGMDKLFHPTHYNGCNYLSMLGLKLIHVSKRGHWSSIHSMMPSDAKCWHRSGSSLAKVMACSWRQQAITETDVDLLSKVFCAIQLRTISWEGLVNLFTNMCSEITITKLPTRSPRGQWVDTNETLSE